MRPPTIHLDRADDGRVRAVVQGVLDAAGVQGLIDALDGATGASHVEVDLRGVSFIDSGGLHFLADVEERNRRRDIATTFVCSNPTMVRAFEIVGFLERFDVRREPPRPGDPERLGT